jgi:ribosomal protein S18 acetylase RimI-like enzyme
MKSPTRVRRDETFVRVALHGDEGTVRELDDSAFLVDDPDMERAAPDVLEKGVLAGRVWLLDYEGEAVAYVHAVPDEGERVYIEGIGIESSKQGRGIGSILLEHCLHALQSDLDHGLSVVTVTSGRNLPMLSLLLKYGFVGRWALPGFFGPGRDRLGLQLRRGDQLIAPPTVVDRIPVTDVEGMYARVKQGLLLTSITRPDPQQFVIAEPKSSGSQVAEPPSSSIFRADWEASGR